LSEHAPDLVESGGSRESARYATCCCGVGCGSNCCASSGRTVAAADSVGPINYALNASYALQGALASLQNGANIVSTFYYNNRLQPCRISVPSAGVSPASCTDAVNIGNVLDFTYGFNAGSANNGNVASILNNRTPERSQNFTYDELNRIKSAQTQATSGGNAWGLSFGYDVWANLLSATVTQGSAPPLGVGVNAKNQVSNTGFVYDAAGNMTSDGSLSVTYDAENRIISTNAGVTYTYDGDGKRVKKSNGKLYWYGTGSDPLEESDLSGTATADYIFFNSKRTARLDLPSATVHYYFANHLGSASVVTSSAGAIQDESDYYPFGGERAVTDTDPNPYKFTGKERDAESGLDYFGARYYGSGMGRFMSADPLMASAHASDPQSWNRYAYTFNNPLRYIDPDGMEVPKSCSTDPKCKIVVKLNIIYDKSVKWSDKEKKELEAKYLEKAKKDYGTSNIELKTTYSEGTFSRDDSGYHLTGLQKDSLNVYFSNSTGTSHAGVAFNTPYGDVAIVDPTHFEALSTNLFFPLGTNTFEHELAHHFLGHTSSEKDYASGEAEADWRVYKQGVWGRPVQEFRQGLEPKTYAAPANPEAIKPKQ
jgi:RHS repeat-associated protein